MLDLSQVTRINSAGIRAWLDAAHARDEALELSFERCSFAIVSQLNMHPELTEGVRVTSITAPYFCPNCRLEVSEVLQVEALDAAELERALGVGPEERGGVCMERTSALVVAVLGVAAIVLLVLGAALFVVGTQPGTRWAVAQGLARSPVPVSVTGIEGTLLGPHYPGQGPGGRFLEGRLELIGGGGLVEDGHEVDDGDGGRGHADGHTVQLALQRCLDHQVRLVTHGFDLEHTIRRGSNLAVKCIHQRRKRLFLFR